MRRAVSESRLWISLGLEQNANLNRGPQKIMHLVSRRESRRARQAGFFGVVLLDREPRVRDAERGEPRGELIELRNALDGTQAHPVQMRARLQR